MSNYDNLCRFFDKTTNFYLDYKPKSHSEDSKKIIETIHNARVLSLGCGGGREVKLLVENGNKVLAIDFSKKMIESSKKIEPKAIYFCENVINFAKRNKDVMKFDYILGLNSFLNYIDLEDRKELIDNLYSMLNKNGKMIFTFTRTNSSLKTWIKVIIYRMIGFIYGSIMCDDGSISHLFTKSQLKELFKEYNYNLSREILIVTK